MGSGVKSGAKRRGRFRRNVELPSGSLPTSNFEIRRRDLDIIKAVASARFLNTEQVCRLFACACPRVEKRGVRGGKPAAILVKQHRYGCSCTCGVGEKKREHAIGCVALFKDDQHVGSRLRELYQAGYLERPVVQLQLRVQNGVVASGSVPMVYCVNARGLSAIGSERREEIGHGKLSWAKRINEGTRIFMEHTLAIADVSVGVDCAVRARPHLERLSEAALQAGMSDRRRNSPRPWSLEARYKGKDVSAICDLALAIADSEGRKRWNYLVEVDRGHMPVERSGLGRTSIMRKLIAYAKAHEDGLHKKEFGWRDFRVLILTTSSARVLSCVKAARERFGSAAVARIFLFGTPDDARDVLDAEFVDVNGKHVRLIEERVTEARRLQLSHV